MLYLFIALTLIVNSLTTLLVMIPAGCILIASNTQHCRYGTLAKSSSVSFSSDTVEINDRAVPELTMLGGIKDPLRCRGTLLTEVNLNPSCQWFLLKERICSLKRNFILKVAIILEGLYHLGKPTGSHGSKQDLTIHFVKMVEKQGSVSIPP